MLRTLRPLVTILIVYAFMASCEITSGTTNALEAIVNDHPEGLGTMIDNPKFEIQILYTQINRDINNIPHLQSYHINRDDELYFYPASTVKMPVAFLALQRINELNKDQIVAIDMDTRLAIDSVRTSQSPAYVDSASISNYPNIKTYIEKIFSVSDNDAYNRLYEFLGQDYINEELRSKGVFRNSRIRTRVGVTGFDTEDNKYTNPIRLISKDEKLLYEQDEYYALYSEFPKLKDDHKGKGFYSDELDSVIMSPFDMSEKNFINLTDLEATLRRIIFPELYDETEAFSLTQNQYNFLYRTMPKKPLAFDFNRKNIEAHYDSYVKFFINGDNKDPIPENIKIFNKVGWAYGTLTDCSYIIDTTNKIEFFISATIHVNKNDIFNDGKYEYEDIGLPFMARLGKAVYNYELKRRRKYKPNFLKFNL